MASAVKEIVSSGQAVDNPGEEDQLGPSTPTPKAKAGQKADSAASPSLGGGNGDAKVTPVKTMGGGNPKKTAKGVTPERARGPDPSPASKADKDAVPVTKPSPRRCRRRANRWNQSLTKRNKVDKGNADMGKSKMVTDSEQMLGLKQSPAIKAEPGSTPARLFTPIRKTDKGPTTPTKKRTVASETFLGSPLSEQVRDLEEKEERQRSRRQKLEMENRLLNKSVSRLSDELSSALGHVTRLESASRSLHRMREQTAKKLGETTDALHEERARAEGFRVAANKESAARAALAAKEEVLNFELRKFRTALATAFKLLPSLTDKISFRQLVLLTDKHLRNRMAKGGGAETEPSLAPGAASAGASEARGANDGDEDDEDDEDDPEPNLNPHLGSNLPGIVEAQPATVQPAQPAQRPATETTPAGEVRGQKRGLEDTPYGWWTANEFDVPLAKRRGNIK